MKTVIKLLISFQQLFTTFYIKQLTSMDYEKIFKLAQAKGITIPQLAEKIGMSSSIYRTLSNKSLRVDTLEKIAETLDVSVEDFFYEVGEFKTDGTDLKIMIGLYIDLIEQIIRENPELNNRESIITKFESYKKLINLDEYNWFKTRWH